MLFTPNSDGNNSFGQKQRGGCFQHHQRPVPHVHPAVSGLPFNFTDKQEPTGKRIFYISLCSCFVMYTMKTFASQFQTVTTSLFTVKAKEVFNECYEKAQEEMEELMVSRSFSLQKL